MYILLCRSCSTLLYSSLRLLNKSNVHNANSKLYSNFVSGLHGSGLSPGGGHEALQRSLSTSAQAVLLPQYKKKTKKKENQKIKEKSLVEESTVQEDVTDIRPIPFDTFSLDISEDGQDCIFPLEIHPEEVETCDGAVIETEDPVQNELQIPEKANTQGKNVKKKKSSKKSQKVEETELKNEKTKKTKSTKQSDTKNSEVDKELSYAARKLHLMLQLKSYVDVCLRLNQHEHAHNTVLMYLERGKRRLASCLIDDISVFNILLKHSAKKGNLAYVKSVVRLLENEKIALDWQSYISWLEAVGRQTNMADFLLQAEVNYVITAMKKQGLSPEDIFVQAAPTKEEKEIISKLFQTKIPDIELKSFTYPEGYTCPLLQGCEHVTEKNQFNTKENVVISIEELRKQMFAQISQENKLFVKVKSVNAGVGATNKTKFLHTKLQENEECWRKAVTKSFKTRLELFEKTVRNQKTINISPYLKILPPEVYVELIMHEIRSLSQVSDYYGTSLVNLRKFLGIKIMVQHQLQVKEQNGFVKTMTSLYSKFLRYSVDKELSSRYSPREYWQHLLLSHNFEHFKVGKFLYDILFSEVLIDVNTLSQTSKKLYVPAFHSVTVQTSFKAHEEIRPHFLMTKLYRESGLHDIMFDVTALPMLCPPVPWTNVDCGGFLLAATDFMRIPHQSTQMKLLKYNTPAQQLYPIFDSLNNLGMCPWIINKPVLDLIIQVFNEGGSDELDVPVPPSRLELPPEYNPQQTSDERKAVGRKRAIYWKEKREMHSLWCDALYKLSVANHFRDDIFWFPHNLDFRGRAYATPPHFNHLGSDLIRSILLFANGQPLGKNGLDWLKIHLINLTGLQKRQSNEKRLQYANDILPEILDSADNPLTGNGWWKKSEDPWQTLACCKEIAKAIRCADPESHICHYPVHQDGSCNGLQHYAALGRDAQGAKQVNLASSTSPQDVYSAVAAIVEQERAKDAENGIEIAILLENHINRKIVKQTVMTTVYGVTRYGARLQVLKQLKDISSFPRELYWRASHYISAKIFLSIGEIFSNTSVIQYWLTDMAGQISRVQSKTVEWVTPVGLPVVQPYLKTVNPNAESRHSIGLPNIMKQKNGFAPNFIHSLDSTHMMLTSLFCQRKGIDFVSVHDCYWTHPNSVDIMNKVCREQFVALHSQPILEDLSDFMYKKFSVPESEITNDGSKVDNGRIALNQTLKRVPPKGTFNLEEILQSEYFFS